jgi:hypothetical protein
MGSLLQRALRLARWLKPTWRQGFLMLATFVVGSVALYTFLFAAKSREDAALVQSWFNLVEDCRTSVESREPLFMLNVLPTGASPDPVRVIGMSRAKMWAPLGGGGRFAIMEHEDDTPIRRRQRLRSRPGRLASAAFTARNRAANFRFHRTAQPLGVSARARGRRHRADGQTNFSRLPLDLT